MGVSLRLRQESELLHMRVRNLQERELVSEYLLLNTTLSLWKKKHTLTGWVGGFAGPDSPQSIQKSAYAPKPPAAYILKESAGSTLPLLPVNYWISSQPLKYFSPKIPLNPTWQFSICCLLWPPWSTHGSCLYSFTSLPAQFTSLVSVHNTQI